MDDQKILEAIGTRVFGWIFSKFMDKGFGWFKSINKKSKDEFDEIVDKIVNKYSHENLRREHLISLFQDEIVMKNLQDFEIAKDNISTELLVTTLSKIIYNNEKYSQDIAEKIISDLLEEIKYFVFNDSYYSASFAHSIMMQLERSSSTYAQNILQSINVIDKKVELGFARNDENVNNILNGISEIKQMFMAKPEQLHDTNDKEINKIIKIANDFLNEGKILAARKIYLELLIKVKEEEIDLQWKLNSNIGKTYINESDENKGIEYFIRAYKYFPEEEKGLIQLAYVKLIERNLIDGRPIVEKILANNPFSEEALLIKCNLLAVNELYAEAFETIKLTKLDNFNSLYTYGFALFKGGELEKSKGILVRSLEFERSPMALDLLATIILEQTQNILKNNRPLRIKKNQQIHNSLIEAKKYLDEAIDIFKKQEGKKLLASAYHNRGVLYSFLQEKDKCLYDFIKSLELGLEEGIIYHNLGVAYIQNSDYRKAYECFSKAYSMGEVGSFDYLLNSLVLMNDLTKAKKLILEKVSGRIDDLTEKNVMCYLILTEIYKRELEENQSNIIIATLRQTYPQNNLILEREIQFLREEKQLDKAIGIIEKHLLDTNQKDELINYMLAELYFEKHEWDKSEKLLEQLFGSEYYDHIERYYLYSVINQGKYQKALEFINEIQTNSNLHIEELQRIKGEILFYHEKFIEAKELFNMLATNYKKVDDYVMWGLSEFRLGYFDKAEIIFKNALEKFHDKPKDLLRISSAYSIIGKTKDALKIAFEVIKKLPENIDAVKNYLMIFINHTQQNPDDPIDNSMKEIFQENINNYEIRFPDDNSWQKKDVGKDFEELKRMLRENEKFLKNISELYDFHRLPLSIVSKFLDRNIYQTWAGYCNQNDRKIWAYNSMNSKREYQLIQDYHGEIVVEPIAFFTLCSLNRIELLNRFSKCHFPQRLLDILHQEVSNLRMSSNSGLLTLFSLDGQLYKNEIPVWEIENSIKKILEMIEYVKGSTFGYEIEKRQVVQEKDLMNFIDESTSQALQFAQKNKVPLLIDEASLLEYFQINYEIDGFSTLTLFRLARSTKVINTQGFNTILLKLISANYYFISINADLVLQGLRQHDFQMSLTNQYILKYLKQPDINEISVAIVLADVFIGLYSENIGEIRKNCWIDYSLDCLPRNNVNTTALLKLIYERVKNSYKNLIEYKEVVEWLDMRMNTWSISRCVPYFK